MRRQTRQILAEWLRAAIAVPLMFGLMYSVIWVGLALTDGWLMLPAIVLWTYCVLLAIVWVADGRDGFVAFVNSIWESIVMLPRRWVVVTIDHPALGSLKARNGSWLGHVDSAIMGERCVLAVDTAAGASRGERCKPPPPTERQVRVVQSYLQNDASLREAIAHAILVEYEEIRRANDGASSQSEPLDELFPPITDSADVWKQIKPALIEVLSDHPGNRGLEIGLHWEADWDCEHGLHVLLRGNQVVEAYME